MPVVFVSALLGGAGVLHFVSPDFFDSMVPEWMPGPPRAITYLSGAAELTAAALVARPRTRRVGGLVALGTFVVVFPANIWAALEGGMEGAEPPFDSATAAWIRLPFQVPMIWAAYLVHRDAPRPVVSAEPGC